MSSIESNPSLTLPAIQEYLAQSGTRYEVWPCDPALADTVQFCKHYGVAPESSANTILVKSKTGPEAYAVCVVLASTRLDVNQTVRRKLGARKVSFASADETIAITGMEIGGVTPIGLPPELPVWVDARVMACESIVLGGGNRSSKLKINPAALRGLPQLEVVADLGKDPPALPAG